MITLKSKLQYILPHMLYTHLGFASNDVLYAVSAFIGTGQVMGWGHKAIEIRAVDTGHLDGVFMHKKAQKLKFLCERNDKVQSFVVIASIYHSYYED